MTDLDLRLVRGFTVVARLRHFGRAAGELHLTQSSLSRQILRLEQQVGARLLDRTPQGTKLTEAGEAFLPLALEVLSAAAGAAAHARAIARPSRITVGYTGNLIITPAVRELRRRHPEAEARTQHLAWDDARAALLEHRVDVIVVRLPLRAAGLRVTVLYDEPRVLLLPRDHRLAGKESVTLADIADEPLPRASDPEWDAFWRVDPRPDGRPAPDGPWLSAVEDKFELVASGEALAIVPAGPGTVSSLRADLTTVPLADVEPSQVAVATRAGEQSRLVAAFGRYATALLTGEPVE
ncbi:LysR family transcriptional regulator [Amycolatopsis sp. OK19-0408]|uniref:LysR family transcriptional regulator n=1 Tax=Amycolatopsis iheyensis TaxID=2945988 RepID=A0A9X2NE24_9PSEU|nr:LysR family transcriptional regulator [Amycolatopsis iheyensis]MCR6485150.1 LysR family transcriptional regulator [Amycolatopsis iheyensis]